MSARPAAAALVAGLALVLGGCGETCPFDEIALPEAPVTEEAGVLALLDATRAATFPDLDGVAIGAEPVEDLQFFRAWTEIETVGLDDGRARTYTVQYDPVVLSDPPAPAALAAVLTHELGHVHDYVGMTGEELLEFAAWYGSQDPAESDGLRDYERATDEQALERGCGAALAEMRTWIYAHSEGEVLADKQRNYYSPAEIEAWMEANGPCPAAD